MGRTPYTFEGCSYMITRGKFEIKPWKMFFGAQQIVFLGHVVTR
jgi:hypothetical protein